MAGNPKIVVSVLADADLQRVIEFLEERWSIEFSIRFIDRYYQKLDLIESMPGVGFLSRKDPKIRKVKVDRHNVICYEIRDSEIIILRILDTRSNPDSNPY